MSVHVEWLQAKYSAAALAQGGDVIGDGTVADFALVIGDDDLVVIEGTQAELALLVTRMFRALAGETEEDELANQDTSIEPPEPA